MLVTQMGEMVETAHAVMDAVVVVVHRVEVGIMERQIEVGRVVCRAHTCKVSLKYFPYRK